MMNLLTNRQAEWLGRMAGMRIDALDQSLSVFAPEDIDSVIRLQRNIRCILDEAREIQLAAIAAAAEKADKAGVLDLRSMAGILMMLLRGAVSSAHFCPPPQGADERDEESGLLNLTGFAKRLESMEADGNLDAALAVIRISEIKSFQARHGDKATRDLIRHAASILTRHFRGGDCVAHVADGEFVVILPGEDSSGIHTALSRIDATSTRKPFRFPGGHCEIFRFVVSASWIGGKPFAAASAADTTPGDAADGVLRAGVLAARSTTRRALAYILRQSGYEVVAAGGESEEELEAFARKRLHVIVVEQSADELPEEIAWLRTRLSHRRTPVIAIVTGPEMGLQALQNGAMEFLTMPVARETLDQAVLRLTRRSNRDVKSNGHGASVLVASDSIGQLIAIGSALQRQGSYNVRLGHGFQDAVAQASLHAPCAAIIDLPLRDEGLQLLCQGLTTLKPEPLVVFIAGEAENFIARKIDRPRVAGIIPKSTSLLALHASVKAATGIVSHASATDSARILGDEILRVIRGGAMKMGQVAAPAPPAFESVSSSF